MSTGDSFSQQVRQELSRLPRGTSREDRTELAALLTLAGRRAGSTVVVESRSGATVRRIYALVEHRHGCRPELRVTTSGGDRGRVSYGLRLTARAGQVLRDAGLPAGNGDGPLSGAVTGLPSFVTGQTTGTAYLRGALIASGSVSAPDRAPHLEIATGSPRLARPLARRASRWLGATVTAPDDGRHRVVVKSGEAIGELLGRVGATAAYLAWEERRLRRHVRGQATRLANADAANVRRTIEAAAEQRRLIQEAVAAVGWEGLSEDLRQVARARLEDRSASLAELGRRCDPPVGKSAVHRRLQRLAEMAESAPAD